jgi:hypothetical protein
MRQVIYSRKPTKPKGLVADRGTDAIWAALTILGLPVIALSLTGMDISPVYAFLIACVATLLIMAAEALVRGKLWFFQEKFVRVFGHEQTPFRVLLLAGGVLLILQTFLLIQLIWNPNVDGVILNLIVRKQCGNPQTQLSTFLCPLFNPPTYDFKEFPVIFSLENSAKAHLMPTEVFGTCTAIPLENMPNPEARMVIRFFAACVPWSQTANEPPMMRIIRTELMRDDSGFYVPLTWQEDTASDEYRALTGNATFLRYVNEKLTRRHTDILRQYTAQ